MRGAALLVAGAIAFQAICAPARATDAPVHTQTPLETEQALIRAGIENFQTDEYEAAKEQLEAARSSPVFAALDSDIQQSAIYFLALDDQRLGNTAAALQLAKEIVKSEDADAGTWNLLLDLASRQRDLTSEAQAASVLARRWPKLLGEYRDDYIVDLVGRLDRAKNYSDRRDLLEALANSSWRPTVETFNTAELWYWIVLDRIERNDIGGARLIAPRVAHEHFLIEMQADKRFDSVTSADQSHLDPMAVAHRRLDLLKALVVDQPRRLKWRYLLGRELTELGRQDDALDVLDKAIALTTEASGRRNYDDEDEALNWVLDTRATVLGRLGRYDEALAIQIAASKQVENGDLNVSNLLNLAEMYVDLGRPTDALALLARAQGRGMNNYGNMVLQAETVCAYAEAKTPERAATALAYVRKHQDDGPRMYSKAMLCIDDRKALVESIKSQLADLKTRDNTLLELQMFKDEPNEPAFVKAIEARFSAAEQDPELQAAIRAVGHINSYDLLYPAY